MSNYADLSTAAAGVATTKVEYETKKAALEAKEPDVAAVLTAEQAALDAATNAYNAARATARDAVGWTAAKSDADSARDAYMAARANFDSVVSQLEPLE